MKRIMWLLFLRPLAIAVGMVATMILIWDLRLGDDSPGLVALTKFGMQYWIPLLVIVFFVVPSIIGLWRIAQLNTQAKIRGLTFSGYMAQLNRNDVAQTDTEGRDV